MGRKPDVALVHDYLTQRGGAERVVLTFLHAFPQAPLYTALYLPDGTFPDFKEVEVRTLPLNHVGLLRRQHRLGLPLYAAAFGRTCVDARVTLASSSGWAHGVRTTGRKIVYCHAPARWLYQSHLYLDRRQLVARGAVSMLGPALRAWDRQAALSADRYLTQSSAVQQRIHSLYGIEAQVLPAPHAMDPSQARRPLPGIRPRFLLCVARLLPYKNVAAVVEALQLIRDTDVVVVGRGPEEDRLRAGAPRRTHFLGTVHDDELRWLYAHCAGLVAASYEDYGLTPLEAGAFGRPSAVLRGGGFLDTVVDGKTGVFFDQPDPPLIADAVQRLLATKWDQAAIRAHAAHFGERAFVERLRQIVADERATLDGRSLLGRTRASTPTVPTTAPASSTTN